MNAILNQLMNRRSVRAYKDEAISEETLNLIKQAIVRAPTAGNMTFYSVIIVNDSRKKKELSVLCDDQPMIAKAPLVMIFLADMQKHYDYMKLSESDKKMGIGFPKPGLGDFHLAMQDSIIAAQTAVVAADSLGLGSVYIGDIIENYEKVQSLLDLPKYAVPACMVIMGYPKTANKNIKLVERCKTESIFMEDSYESKTKEQFDNEWKIPLEIALKTRKIDFENPTYADLFYKKKFTSSFMKEMNRSVKVFLDKWMDEN
jgi:nitroreductase